MKAISPRSAVDSVRQHTPALPLALLPLLSAGGSPVTIENSGNIQAEGPTAFGIRAKAYGANSPISVTNSGDIDPVTGIDVRTYGDHSPIAVDNSGDVEATQVGIPCAERWCQQLGQHRQQRRRDHNRRQHLRKRSHHRRCLWR
jgi:hypothetical protein